MAVVLVARVAHAHQSLPDGGELEDDEHEPLDAGVVVSEPLDAGTPFVTQVHAPRLARSASEVRIGQDVIQAAPRRNATDLLRLAPGLVASQHSGEGKAHQYFLRGFDAVHGQDVELVVAGIPVNAVSHLHAQGYADVTWLIPEAVKELRVFEGTSRAFQGDFAVAGTLRFELGLEEPGLHASASYGTFGLARGFVGFRPWEDNETFAAAEYQQGNGFGPERAFSRYSVLGQAQVPLPHGARLRAVVGSAASRFGSPGVVKPTDDFFSARFSNQGGATSRHQVLLGVELPHETGRTTLELHGVLADDRLRNNFTGFLERLDGDGREQQHDALNLGVNLEHHQHFTVLDAPLALDVGLGGRRSAATQLQRRYREPDGVITDTEFEGRFVQSTGFAWVEAAWSPGRWRLMLGTRADVLAFDIREAQSRAALGGRVGLKAGVSYGVSAPLRLFLNYGDGFRSPVASSLRDGERAPFVTVRAAELGARWDSERVSAQAVAFGSYVADDFFFDHLSGTTTSTGASLRGGVTLSGTAKPFETWLINASGTAAHARVIPAGTLLPYFAPLVARLDTAWTPSFEALGRTFKYHLGAGLTFIGPRPLRFDEFSSGALLVDLKAGVRSGPIELHFDVTNLFDRRWRDGEFVYPTRFEQNGPTSLLPTRQFTAGAPCTVTLTLELHL